MWLEKLKGTIKSSIQALPLSLMLLVNNVSAITCDIVSSSSTIIQRQCWNFTHYTHLWPLFWRSDIQRLPRSPSFNFENKYLTRKEDNSLSLFYWECNALYAEYNWLDVVWTAKHCFHENNSDEQSVFKDDIIIVGKNEFEANTKIDLDKYKKYKIWVLNNVNDYLGKEFMVVWTRGNENYSFRWYLVELSIDKENWITNWVLYFSSNEFKDFWSTRWFSWAAVFLFWKYDYAVAVLSWEKWDDKLFISFYTIKTPFVK